ncbi:MAG: type I asparaginase, partial [Planctomycetota bacterium]
GDSLIAGFLQKQLDKIDELGREGMPEIELFEYQPVIDSSQMTPSTWLKIASDIYSNYDNFDGFVVIHGTDTMAHTSSALPFMLEGLNKPVILTGSQIPLLEIRNDARENLITAIMLAADFKIPEVCIFFGNRLIRGCRATKVSATSFGAFDSPNFPPLGTVGTNINIFTHRFRQPSPQARRLKITPLESQSLATFRLFPGVNYQVLDNVLDQPLVALVLETFGLGNGPSSDQNITRVIREATDRGTIVVSCTQCQHGKIEQTSYDAGSALFDAGVVSGADMTIEAALAKLQFLFTKYRDRSMIRKQIELDLVGELTADQ